jgi:hypothetical protein
MSRSARWSDRVEPPVSIAAGQSSVGPTSAPESMPPVGSRQGQAAERRPRLSGQQLTSISATLSDRDKAVMESLHRFGFLRSHHVEHLHFPDHATDDAAGRICRRTLGRLRRLGLVDTLERRIGGLRAGSASYVWRLSAAGDRLLRAHHPDAPRARRKEPSLRFLAHRLAVADCYCRLVTADRAGVAELLSAALEPASWRTFIGGHGAREVLKPDLMVITATADYEDHWFIEVDLGTESLPTVLRQCRHYERYRRSGHDQRTLGLFPRVVWLVPDDHRRARLRAAIDKAADLDSNLFIVETFEALQSVVGEQPTSPSPEEVSRAGGQA